MGNTYNVIANGLEQVMTLFILIVGATLVMQNDGVTVGIRQALQLGMPVGRNRFAELVCATEGIRFNSGKRGRAEGKPKNEVTPVAGQKDFGF